MKIGIIIPDRGDRPALIANCLNRLNQQINYFREKYNAPCDFYIAHICFEPSDEKKDITKRYRTGYNYLRAKGIDVIAFIENDDWYSVEYLWIMVSKWLELEKPVMLGHTYTIYYHIKLRSYFTMEHYERSSAMNMLIVPDLKIDWCIDEEPFTDLHLWNTIKNGKLFTPEKHICIGIKHGYGLCGGSSHTDRLQRYDRAGIKDADYSFLSKTLDFESFLFYKKIVQDEINGLAEQDNASINLN